MTTARGLLLSLAAVCVTGSVVVLLTRNVAVKAKTATAQVFPNARPAPLTSTTTSSLEVPQRESGPVRMVRFVLFDAGVYPRELHVQAGLINIAIEDKTKSTAGLVIERVSGSERSRAGEVRRFANHWRGKEIIRLSPGHYRVYDASRPGNQAKLIAEP